MTESVNMDTDLLTDWWDDDTATYGAHPDYRHAWERDPFAAIRQCSECGTRETYWDDHEYGHDACPSAVVTS